MRVCLPFVTATWKLLQLLVEADGRVLAYGDLLRSLWGSERRDRMTSLRRVVQHLRWKIEFDARHPVHILTEARIGYRFALHGRTQYGAERPDRG